MHPHNLTVNNSSFANFLLIWVVFFERIITAFHFFLISFSKSQTQNLVQGIDAATKEIGVDARLLFDHFLFLFPSGCLSHKTHNSAAHGCDPPTRVSRPFVAYHMLSLLAPTVNRPTQLAWDCSLCCPRAGMTIASVISMPLLFFSATSESS